MLKLVFFIKELRLRVRTALPEDDFSESCKWQDKLEFIVANSHDYTMVWSSILPDLEPAYAHAFVELIGARYPVSPHYKKLKSECPAFVFSEFGEEWVFFAGSFHPWHLGHQACIELLPKDKLCLIAPDRNPQKELRELNPVTTILEISSRSRLGPKQFLVPTFLLEHKKNPTVDWVERLKSEYPTQKISLLMGFDALSKLKSWIRPQDLLMKLHTLYVVSRLEDDDEKCKALDEIYALVGTNIDVVFLGKHDYEYLSSTDIRKKGFYAL